MDIRIQFEIVERGAKPLRWAGPEAGLTVAVDQLVAVLCSIRNEFDGWNQRGG